LIKASGVSTISGLIIFRVHREIDLTRVNRCLHALADWLAFIATMYGTLFMGGEVFVVDSLPVPVCRRVRARRYRKVCGQAYCGYCAAKREKFFGWRLHLTCTPAGVPVSFPLLPAMTSSCIYIDIRLKPSTSS
jgi:hypothetical protein